MTQDVYEQPLTLRLHDMDAAGVMFFGHLFRHAHDVYEGFMQHIGFALPRLIQAGEYHLPIVHTEADYRQAMRHGEVLNARLQLERVGDTSFISRYSFQNKNGDVHALAKCVHVCMNPGTGGSMTLPPDLREALLPYLVDSQ